MKIFRSLLNELALKRNISDAIALSDMSQDVITAFNGTGTIPPYQSVTPDLTSFLTLGKNLFNKDTVNTGEYIAETNGELSVNASYNASDYIRVSADTAYYANEINRIAYYDNSKVFISGAYPNYTNGGTITTPAGCVYVRYSFHSSFNLNNMQFEAGTSKTLYEAYGYCVDNAKLARALLSANNVNFLTTGKNLYNYATDTVDTYISWTSGNPEANADYRASDFIPVLPNTEYTQSTTLHYAWYDVNKVFISGSNSTNASGPRTITSPSNAVYIRVNTRISTNFEPYSSYQLELGSENTTYESWNQRLVGALSQRGNFSLLLPPEINIAVGDTMEIYNKNICHCGNMDNFHFKYTCNIGKQWKRKWNYTAIEGDVGAHTMTVDVYDNDLNLILTRTTTINVVNVSTPISTPKNILCIGDSLTNDKAWMTKWKALSDAMFGADKIVFIGTRGATANKHEGYSGYNVNYFISDPNVTGSANPFWNPGTSQLDFAYYLSHNTIAMPDFIQIYLGTNDLTDDLTAEMARYKTLVDFLLAGAPSAKIFIVLPEFWGDQNSLSAYGTQHLELLQHRRVFNYINSLLNQFIGYNARLTFVPLAQTMDSEWAFNPVTQAVNQWSAQTETIQTGDVHPVPDAAYYQNANAMFGHFVKHYLD